MVSKWDVLREYVEYERKLWAEDASQHRKQQHTVLKHRSEGHAAMCDDVLAKMRALDEGSTGD